MLGTFCYTNQAVFPIYFVARISQPAKQIDCWKLMPEMTGIEAAWSGDSGEYKIYKGYAREIMGDDIGAIFRLGEVEPGTVVEVKVGISYVSMENARKNLEAEVGTASFDGVMATAQQKWNDALGRIRITGGTEQERTIFYTALYHALLHPNIISDIKVVIAMSSIGSFVPDMPTPLSSEERSFFIQSSDETFCSCGTSLLYFANRSLPLCRACSLMLPFCPISAR